MAPKSTTRQQDVSDKTQDESSETKPKGSLESIVKDLVKKGKTRGFVTYDELNRALPTEEFSSEQIEDAMASISDLGIQLVESEEDEGEAEEAAAEGGEEKGTYQSSGNIGDDDTGRTDDPVRMYLREMGSVELLSREGEIAIAKRIEAGKEMMIGGICESPLAIEAMIAWYDALQKGDILLREVIDLDATFSGDDSDSSMASGDDDSESGDGENDGDGDSGDSEDEGGISLSAMEEQLMPQVFETFAKIQKTYKAMQKVQAVRIEAIAKGKEPSAADNKKYMTQRDTMVGLMNEIRLNNARIDQLVERLYKINRELVSNEGRMMRLAVDCGVKREDFIKEYFGGELDTRWLGRV
jgi:RNA polymerase primary sigma factor